MTITMKYDYTAVKCDGKIWENSNTCPELAFSKSEHVDYIDDRSDDQLRKDYPDIAIIEHDPYNHCCVCDD